jgi:hypothetical protein
MFCLNKSLYLDGDFNCYKCGQGNLQLVCVPNIFDCPISCSDGIIVDFNAAMVAPAIPNAAGIQGM